MIKNAFINLAAHAFPVCLSFCTKTTCKKILHDLLRMFFVNFHRFYDLFVNQGIAMFSLINLTHNIYISKS